MSIPISQSEIENWFNYHTPTPGQSAKYVIIRKKARDLAHAIVDLCPPSADTTAAIRKLREVVMTANASVACGPREDL
jgi:hypothetical protein